MMEKDYSALARAKFDEHFPKAHSFVTSLHSIDIAHALEGAKISYENGADGVAVVTHLISPADAIKAVDKIKQMYPEKQAIINVL